MLSRYQLYRMADLKIQVGMAGGCRCGRALPGPVLCPKQVGVFVDNPKCHDVRVCEALSGQGWWEITKVMVTHAEH